MISLGLLLKQSVPKSAIFDDAYMQMITSYVTCIFFFLSFDLSFPPEIFIFVFRNVYSMYLDVL